MKKIIIIVIAVALIGVASFSVYSNRNIIVEAKIFNETVKIDSKANDSLYNKVSKHITDFKSELELKPTERIVKTEFEFRINGKEVKYEEIAKVDASKIEKFEADVIETVENKVETPIAYTTEVVENADLYVGEEQISVAGVNGSSVSTKEVVYKNNKMIKEGKEAVETVNAVNEVKIVGTKNVPVENSTTRNTSRAGSNGGGGSNQSGQPSVPTAKGGQFPDFNSCMLYIRGITSEGLFSCDPHMENGVFDGSYDWSKIR